MELDYLATVLLSSLSSASVLLIATVGLAIVFGLMGVINLAHGEFIMFGAYVALFATRSGVPFPSPSSWRGRPPRSSAPSWSAWSSAISTGACSTPCSPPGA